jgi:hypothetical protein
LKLNTFLRTKMLVETETSHDCSLLLSPQCSRYALRIGSLTIPLVKVIRVIFYPVAGPLGKMLDLALGRELATTYSNAEMLKLLQIHVQENAMDLETAGAMTGALTYKVRTAVVLCHCWTYATCEPSLDLTFLDLFLQNTKVKEVMTPIELTYMLSVDDKLSFETIAKIFKTGYSRIPIYEVTVVSRSLPSERASHNLCSMVTHILFLGRLSNRIMSSGSFL